MKSHFQSSETSWTVKPVPSTGFAGSSRCDPIQATPPSRNRRQHDRQHDCDGIDQNRLLGSRDRPLRIENIQPRSK
jgi:hypothetical protein